VNLAGSLVTKNQPIPQKIRPGWRYSQVKYLGRYINGYAFKPEDWSDEGKPILRIQNLSNPNASFNRYQGSLPEAYIVRNGDILISWSASLGVFQWTGEDSWLNQHIFKVDVNRNLVRPEYFRWLASWFISEMAHKAHGSTMQHLTWDAFGSFPVLLPSLEEQCKIANYLDHETVKIDKLISAKERLLDLLTEKRQSLITHVITYGLNPDVPMRDSGVEWIGNIPQHWNIKRIKFLIHGIDTGFSPQCYNFPAQEGEWGVLKTGCVNGGIFNPQENKTLPPEIELPLEIEVKKDDILMSRASGSTDLIGSVALVENQPNERLLLSDKIFRLRLNTEICDANFFVITMGSLIIRQQILQFVSGAEGLANNITQSDIRELLIPIPPIEEQIKIVSFIKEKISTIDTLSQVALKTINYLQERRTTLITAAVTGQIRIEK
jgi:type I restriction enzyme S subunit